MPFKYLKAHSNYLGVFDAVECGRWLHFQSDRKMAISSKKQIFYRFCSGLHLSWMSLNTAFAEWGEIKNIYWIGHWLCHSWQSGGFQQERSMIETYSLTSLMWPTPVSFLFTFCTFKQQFFNEIIVDFSRIWIQTFGVEDEHLTMLTTWPPPRPLYFKIFKRQNKEKELPIGTSKDRLNTFSNHLLTTINT